MVQQRRDGKRFLGREIEENGIKMGVALDRCHFSWISLGLRPLSGITIKSN